VAGAHRDAEESVDSDGEDVVDGNAIDGVFGKQKREKCKVR